MTPATTLVPAVVMWMLMMTAMMVPGTIPAVRIHSRMYAPRQTLPHTFQFLGGYLAGWLGYSVVGASLQIILINYGMLSTESRLSTALGSVILIGAGLFQFSGLKERCLSKCRNPLTFFLSNWKNGPASSLSLGLKHGLYCVGCCWALMALGFAVGLMDLLWMVAIALIVTAEKVLPAGHMVGRIAGVLLIAWGIARL